MAGWRGGVVALGVLGLVGCDSGAGDSFQASWVAVTDTVGDTVVVRTVSGSVWGGEAELIPQVSIGAVDGAEEYILGDPSSFAVAPDGSVVVLDRQVPVVRIYEADGTHRVDVGREGGGPGEYAGPDAVAVLPDGRILVRDPANQRISLFDLQGGYLGAWYHPGGFNTSRRFYVDQAGRSYATTLLERGVAPWEWTRGVIRYASDGSVVDTVAAPRWAYDAPKLTASREGSSSMRSVPFAPEARWTFSPLGYMVGGLSTAYRIDLYRPDGMVLRLERDAAPVPVAAAEADERRRRLTQGLQRQYGGWRWNGPSIPDTKPPFQEIFASWEGNVWVRVSTEGVRRPEVLPTDADGRIQLQFYEPPALEVFAPDGRFLGPVATPAGLQLSPEPVVVGDLMWAVVRDQFDLPTLQRFRIEVPTSPSE